MHVKLYSTIGPILILDDVEDGQMRLSALFIAAKEATVPPLELPHGKVPPIPLAEYDHATVWRARFTLPADRVSEYRWNGTTYAVAGDLTGDLRLAYVSCNGEEVGDMEREGSERNAMWERLRSEHQRWPFALMLHGGDQVYADEVTEGHELSQYWPERIPRDPSRAGLDDLRHHLRERFLERYAALYAAPQFAWLAARVPSLMQWDDHDICDGWGSLRRSRTYSPVGQTLFAVARESFLVFQQATIDGDLPARAEVQVEEQIMSNTARLTGEPIMRILCKKTDALVGYLYQWNNGDLQPAWINEAMAEVRYEPMVQAA